MCLLCPQGDSVNFRRKKAFQKQRKPVSYTYRFMSYNHRLLLSHHACFQENSIWMKGICQNKQEETTPDLWALFTHSGYSLSAYGLLALQSLVQGNTQNLKTPTEKTENSFFMGLPPILSPGEKGCSVPLSCRDPCFPPGFTVGPAACCHSLFEGTHRHYGCSPGSPQDMKEEREVYSDSPPPRSKKGWIRPETTLQFQSYPFKIRPFFHMTHYLLVQASAGAAGVCSLYCIAQTVMVSALCFLSQKWPDFLAAKSIFFITE